MNVDIERAELEAALAGHGDYELFACDPALADTAAFCAAYSWTARVPQPLGLGFPWAGEVARAACAALGPPSRSPAPLVALQVIAG